MICDNPGCENEIDFENGLYEYAFNGIYCSEQCMHEDEECKKPKVAM